MAGLVIGFVVVGAVQLRSYAPEARLPAGDRLAALIDRQQSENDRSRSEVLRLQDQLQQTRQSFSTRQAGTATQNDEIESANEVAGIAPVRGSGFVVTLNDSSLENTATSNLNNLVIHSQDVQAVVNGLWQSGAEAISVNGQRLVSTSAVLCVGNTLLLNGSVYAPPYEISAVGADRERFADDALVKRLRSEATKYSLQFTVGRRQNVEIPAYSGSTATKYATPAR